jgi:hypothetical protein
MSVSSPYPNNWLSAHIFYASNANPLILDCLSPLVDDLRARGLIQRYFFIKYWLEGPHVRLRLLPAANVSYETLKAIVDEVVGDYLERRPALYSADVESAQPFYKDLFIGEYGEEAWNERYGAEGRMPFQPNNSIAYIEYEPEYDRYGGVHGIELAEWHFEQSSDTVIRLLRDTNLHVHSIMLGLSLQLSAALAYVFLENDLAVHRFLISYIAYWRQTFGIMTEAVDQTYEKTYLNMAELLENRIDHIQMAVASRGTHTHLTPIEREWIEHAFELRQRVDALVASRSFVFGSGRGRSEKLLPEDKDVAYNILLHSYIHMTNNRIGVLFSDEVYLAYLMKRRLEESRELEPQVVL